MAIKTTPIKIRYSLFMIVRPATIFERPNKAKMGAKPHKQVIPINVKKAPNINEKIPLIFSNIPFNLDIFSFSFISMATSSISVVTNANLLRFANIKPS